MPWILLFDFAEMKNPFVSGGFWADVDADVKIEDFEVCCISGHVLLAVLFFRLMFLTG